MKPSSPLIFCIVAVLAAAMTIVLGQKPGQATQPPCCRDWIGTRSCLKLKKVSTVKFNTSCNNDADFAFNQCCSSCNLLGTELGYNYSYGGIAQRLLINGTGQCFDRMSTIWCQKLLLKTDVWTASQFTCDSSNLAFRVCRQTCGYCSTTGDPYITNLYSDYQQAQSACQTNSKRVIGR